MLKTPDVLDFSNLSFSSITSLLHDHHLNLTAEEVLTIQNSLLFRPPTYAECVLWSIQGSEHCSYKSSRPYLSQFVTSGPHVILGPKEDAGIVAVATDHAGMRYGIVMSHESHNHPSQVVPYEGAATGVGGNIRDVNCMGAEVIAIADGLRFGALLQSKTHWIAKGVVSGIAGYGNPMGIPNLAGDVYFDPGYNHNCLVTVVTLGVVREDHVIHSYAPKQANDYVFILVGKPTDNSGFGGASFASSTLKEEQKERNKGAVQEPNAFLQRHLLKANMALFDILKKENYLDQVGFKDLGAGGIACASVEMAEAAGYGAEVNLECVPTSMDDLQPAVILCSETQERFMWVVPPNLVERVLTHYNEHFALPKVSVGAQAAVIGRIRTDGQYIVNYYGKTIIDAKASDITQGIQYKRDVKIGDRIYREPELQLPHDYHQVLLSLLAHENIASRDVIYEQYDKQVQGRTFLERGCADAGLMQPFNEEKYPEEIRLTGVALALSHNPRYHQIDAYWGAVNAITRAVSSITAVGATPLAITDCLCFGNPEQAEQMGEFTEAVRGINEATRAITLQDHSEFTLPIIAGNVSFYNESEQAAIPPSPMISCLGAMPDVNKALTFSFKRKNSWIVLIGERKDECGGSVYYQLHHELGANVPKPNVPDFNRSIHALYQAVNQGLILSLHGIAEGGLAVALAKMSFKNNIGVKVDVDGALRIDKKLFSETGGFILEVGREHLKSLQSLMQANHVALHIIGETTNQAVLQMNDVIALPVMQAKQAYMMGLRARF